MYFAIVFAVSWGGVLLVIRSTGMPATPDDIARLFPIALIVMLAGPTTAGLLMTGITSGKAGFKNLLSRFTKLKVGLQWYAFALAAVPMLVGPILWLLSQTWPSVYVPRIVTADNKFNLVISALATGLAAGIFEEIGWTGFATPNLRTKHNIVVTGLVVGLLWGLWHFLVTFWASGDPSGRLSQDLLLPPLVFYVGVLPAYRVLMVWVYDRTASLLISMLMHASLTTCTVFLLLPPATGTPLTKYYLILTVVLWAIIANLLPGSYNKSNKTSLA